MPPSSCLASESYLPFSSVDHAARAGIAARAAGRVEEAAAVTASATRAAEALPDHARSLVVVGGDRAAIEHRDRAAGTAGAAAEPPEPPAPPALPPLPPPPPWLTPNMPAAALPVVAIEL